MLFLSRIKHFSFILYQVNLCTQIYIKNLILKDNFIVKSELYLKIFFSDFYINKLSLKLKNKLFIKFC